MSERREFQAEVKQLLDLMIHSLYSHKEVFLRELVSNASDALDRRRFEALTNDAVKTEDELHIRLHPDKAARTLAISDNGIGMSEEEVVKNLGTIAKSGTKEFKKILEAKKDQEALSPDLIGQFGVGFYSAFMVAEEVEVVTRRAGEAKATLWKSSADGSYEIGETERPDAGTTVTLKLKPAAEDDGLEDFTQEFVLRSTIKKYSDFVAYPIKMEVTRTEKDGDDTNIVTQDEQLNSQTAIWARPKSEVTDEEYDQFYQHISHDWTAPATRVDFKIEGNFEAQGLLFVPSRPPYDLYHPEMKRGIQLYVRRVFIMDEAKELAPSWLRFVKGVVDAQDLDLNVSREMLQQNRQIRAIRRQVVKKVVDELARLLKEDREAYEKVWANFGNVLKEGLVQGEDKDRDRLLPIILSPSSKNPTTSFSEYIERMPEGQEEIYYLIARSQEAAKQSPHLEAFEAKGYEVLFFTDNVDEVWLQRTTEFEGKKLVSIGHGTVELDKDESSQKEKKEALEAKEKELKGLLDALRKHLQDEIKEVRLSNRLEKSAVVLVSDQDDMTPQMEQLMRQLGQDVPKVKRILELNPSHAVIARLQSLHDEKADEARLQDQAELLLGQAILAEGGQLPNPARFSELVANLMSGQY